MLQAPPGAMLPLRGGSGAPSLLTLAAVLLAGGAAGGLCGRHPGLRRALPGPGGRGGQPQQQPPRQPGECRGGEGGFTAPVLGCRAGGGCLSGDRRSLCFPRRARSPCPPSCAVAGTPWPRARTEPRGQARPAPSRGHRGTSTAPRAGESDGDGWQRLGTLLIFPLILCLSVRTSLDRSVVQGQPTLGCLAGASPFPAAPPG